MKRIIFIILLLLNFVSTFGQLSMPQLYKQWAIEDINKGLLDKALSEFKKADFTYIGDDADLSLDLNKYDTFVAYAFQKDITDDQKISLYRYTAAYAYSYGDYFYSENQFTEAGQLFSISSQYYAAIQEKFPLEASLSNNMLGNAYILLHRYDEAESAYIGALNILDSYLQDTIDLRYTIANNLVENSLLKRDTVLAEKYFLQNHPIDLPVDTADSYAFMWKILGHYYNARKNYSKAIVYQSKELDLYKIRNNRESLAITCGNIAYNYFWSKDTILAKQRFDEAYNICKEGDISGGTRIYILEGLCLVCGRSGEYPLAESLCQELLDVSIAINDQYAIQTAKDGLLMAALGQEDITKTKKYLNIGANVNNPMWGTHPLYMGMLNDALKFSDYSKDVTKNAFSELLLKSGAKVDQYGSDLETAIMFEDYRLCNLLLQYRANPKAYNYDSTMTIIQLAESKGLKRFVKLLKNKKSYSSRLTIQELDMLYKGANNSHDYKTSAEYCSQALAQFYDEIDETKYQGFRTRQQILFYFVSALTNMAIESELAGDYATAEKLLIQSSQLEEERKKYSEAYDIGFHDINEMLVSAIAGRDSTMGFSHGVDILALNQWEFRKSLGIKDRFYWQTLGEVSHYFKESGAKIDALNGYRQLLRYVADVPNPVDSLGLINYSNMISGMAFLQESHEDSVMLREEFERTKNYIHVLCKDDSLNYYGNIAPLSWHIVPYEEQMRYINRYLYFLEQSPITDSTTYYDSKFLAPLFQFKEIVSHDSIANSHFVESLSPIIDDLWKTQLSLQNTGSSMWIWANYDLKHYDEIWRVAPIYFKSNQEKIKNRLATMSGDIASAWLNSSNLYLTDDFIYHAAFVSNPSSKDLVAMYDNELFRKGLLLRNSANMERYIVESSDSSALYLYNKIKLLRTQREQYRELPHSDSIIWAISKEIDNKERILYNLSGKYQEQIKYDNIHWSDIRNSLAENEVAIEFVNFGYIDQYFALILRREYDSPRLVRLPDFKNHPQEDKDFWEQWYEQDLVFRIQNNFPDSLMPDEPHYLQFSGDAEEIYKYGENGTDLYNALWIPLLEHIKDGDRVYFSPTGLLHQLSIEAFPISSSEVLSDKYDMRRVSSTREIVSQHRNVSIKQVALYGGIVYDVQSDEMIANGSSYDVPRQRGSVIEYGDRSRVNYLKGTKEEIDAISQNIKKYKLKYTIYTEKKANEESFKALDGSNTNVIHIATHGFFWADSVAQKQKLFKQRGINEESPKMVDPLNRCGLLFAGANIALEGRSNELYDSKTDDGVLTAKEISLLDLRNTELVILSACETGRGELTADGVFGLQRAFKQAGVQTIIMSLWKVDDTATKELMSLFYQYWLQGQPKHDALHHAQSDIRKTRKNPYYWAGFIMLD